ncbi:MAG: hypothetical protein K1X28_02400 [Parachlamydiales bacterium]|nr:hypothetical protein [Parachlamydiales bacterium]
MKIGGAPKTTHAEGKSKEQEAPDLDQLFLRVQALYKSAQDIAAHCCRLTNTVTLYRSGDYEIIASVATDQELAMLREMEGHLIFQRNAIKDQISETKLDERDDWVSEMYNTIRKIDQILPKCHPEPIHVKYPVQKCVML